MTRGVRSPAVALVAGLIVLGALLSTLVVPGVFTVDDNNYLVNVLALKRGRVTLANTEGLPPSRELLFFDPTNRSREVTSTPVASTAPPLYAVLALPFSYFGWRGLTALNTLSYLGTILLVFLYSRRYAVQASTPWLAAAAIGLGGYTIEYALGLWPQALSFFLCTAGVLFVGRAIDRETRGRTVIVAAAAGGFLLALAAGVRYQNAVVLAAAGAGLLLLATSRRILACAAYGAAAIIPLAVSGAINHARFGSWNPISKGPGYLSVSIGGATRAITDPLLMFWAQVVDYSWRPELASLDAKAWLQHDAATGVHLIYGVIAKKAVLQSAPWVILAFAVFAAAWVPRVSMADGRRRQLRLLSIVAAAIIFTFSVSGLDRHDGLSFNARYFLELLPLAAVGMAWALDGRLSARMSPFVLGAVAGGVLALSIVLGAPMAGGPSVPSWIPRQVAIMKVPLVLAAVFVAVWLIDANGRPRPRIIAGLASACFGWGLALHATTDVAMSTLMRENNLRRTETLAGVVPDRSAIVAYWGYADATGPLLITRDIVVVDAAADDGRDAPEIVRRLLAEKRKVFVIENGFPKSDLDRLVSDLHGEHMTREPLSIVQLAAQVRSAF